VENVQKFSEPKVLRVRLYLPGDNVKSRLFKMRSHISVEGNQLHFMRVTCFILYCILATSMKYFISTLLMIYNRNISYVDIFPLSTVNLDVPQILFLLNLVDVIISFNNPLFCIMHYIFVNKDIDNFKVYSKFCITSVEIRKKNAVFCFIGTM
jgi:hypothetical protein